MVSRAGPVFRAVCVIFISRIAVFTVIDSVAQLHFWNALVIAAGKLALSAGWITAILLIFALFTIRFEICAKNIKFL